MAGGTLGTSEKRLRWQLRVVQTVFRAEIKRLERTAGSADGEDTVRELRSRSMAILGSVRAELDGSARWHADLSGLVRGLEEELDNAVGNDGAF